MDLAIAVVGIPFVALAAVVLVPLIRFDSPGPAIFRQLRVGKGEQPIKIFKFRTLHINQAEVPTHELAVSSVTRIGRFLRATKVDELPQLVNVLRGEMSLVGPRPCLPSQQEVIEARRAAGVMQLLPGVSGWAQLAGIDMSTPEWLAAVDRQYMVESTIVDDVRVVFATMPGPLTITQNFDQLRPAR